MKTLMLRALALIAFSSLAACGGGSNSNDDNEGGNTSVANSEFSVARGCFNLQSVATNGYVTTGSEGYSAAASDGAATAEPFFLQPATLAKYLFMAADSSVLSAGAGTAMPNSQPNDASIWAVGFDANTQQYNIVSETTGEALAVDDNGALVTIADASAAAAQFKFIPTSQNCAEYPEMPIGMTGQTYKGNGVDQPIIGFADVHTHMGMSSEMSYDDSVGPSAGGVLYGQVFHRLGVPHALEDCEEFHGPNGIRDANNILETNPTGTHDTKGWPTFADWPQRNFLTHQVMYHKWVERAWMSGLRVMVNHGTNIAALCRVGQLYALKPEADCDDMSVAVKQIEHLYDVQDYIDAQNGGPGKGWYRIVRSPQEAREVINEGKLAVILGIEVAQVFDCGVTFLPGGGEQRRCDQDQINAEIDRLWDMGVRHVYPYHDIDSSLGGSGLFGTSDILNFLNFMDTGQFYQTSECRDYPTDEPLVREPGHSFQTGVPGIGGDPLTSILLDATGGLTPVYPAGQRCNERTVTDLGDHAMRAMMAKRMIIDIDHAAYHSKDIMLDIAAEQNPPYPMASSHDAHGGLTSDQAVRLLQAGGTIYPYKGNGIKHREFLEKLKFWHEKAGTLDSQVLGLGYGADANGFGGHPGPRGGDSEPVVYPFTLFQGAGWPAHLRKDPVTVDLLTVPESGKFWHIDEVGMAHYGLVADFVEEVRLESGEEGLTALYNSAEAFIQMWERVWNR